MRRRIYDSSRPEVRFHRHNCRQCYCKSAPGISPAAPKSAKAYGFQHATALLCSHKRVADETRAVTRSQCAQEKIRSFRRNAELRVFCLQFSKKVFPPCPETDLDWAKLIIITLLSAIDCVPRPTAKVGRIPHKLLAGFWLREKFGKSFTRVRTIGGCVLDLDF